MHNDYRQTDKHLRLRGETDGQTVHYLPLRSAMWSIKMGIIMIVCEKESESSSQKIKHADKW